jgi:hypothetical protein
MRRPFIICLTFVALAHGALAFAQSPATITSPANGSTLAGASQMFQWNAAPGASRYTLSVGNSPGAIEVR